MSFLFKKPRKKRLGGLSRYSLLAIATIFFLGFMGIGFAYWNDSLTLRSKLITGYIEPIFTEATLSSDEGDEIKKAVEILEDGRALSVDFDEAEPDGVYYLDFTIKNEGTLPVELNNKNFCIQSKNKYLKLKMQEKPEKILDSREETHEQIEIQVDAPDIEDDCKEGFTIELDYHLAN